MRSALLVLVLALFAVTAGAQLFPFPGPGRAAFSGGGGGGPIAACTNGVDCYCDRATGNGPLGASDPAYNASITNCEDFDDPEFTASPVAGNWVDGSGGNRGSSSLWASRYGNGGWGAIWENGEPSASPTYGVQCAFASCSGMLEWDEDNRWQANAYEPHVDIIDEASDFTAEDATAGTPTIEGSGGLSFFGNALFAYRNGPGTPGNDQGAGGFVTSTGGLGSVHTQLGYTSLWGYDAKVKAYNILDDAWKHDETIGVGGEPADGMLGFRTTAYDPIADQGNERYTFPAHFFIFTPTYSCATAISGVSVNGLGRIFCDAADNIQVETALSVFNFNTDWDLSKHHCVSIYWDFRTISSVTAKFWIDGELVLHLTGLNLTGSTYDAPSGPDGIEKISWNNYANRSALVGAPWTTPRPGVNRRYQDNRTITNSTPQLCSKIGFPSSYNQAGL